MELACKQCTYTKKRSRIAQVLASWFVKTKRPVNARWFELIEKSWKWVERQPPLKYRFDAIFSGDGIKAFFGYSQPEKRLWLNLEYMRLHQNKMVSLETTRQWM